MLETAKTKGPVIVLDVSHLNLPNRGFPPQSKFLAKVLDYSLGGQTTLQKIAEIAEIIKAKTSVAVVADQLNTEKESVVSARISITAKSFGNLPSLLDWLISLRLKIGYRSAFKAAMGLLESHRFCSVLIPNGRFPVQRAVSEAANLASVSKIFFERGWQANHYYLSDLQTQDFWRQREFQRLNSPSGTDLSSARRWLDSRIVDRIHLPELGVAMESDVNKSDSAQDIVFFTSSPDEFIALGNLWPNVGWDNQYQAIESVLACAEGVNCVTIRVHPNSRNKPLSYALWEIYQLRKLQLMRPQINIISPLSNINSYDLGVKAKKIFVWESTIGLELHYLGCHVLSLAPTLYSEKLAQAEAWGLDSKTRIVQFLGSSEKQADPSLAIEFVANWFARERPHDSLKHWSNSHSMRHIIRNILSIRGVLGVLSVLRLGLSARLSRLAYRVLL